MFKLYTEQKPTFSFHDYAMLMAEVKQLGAKSALEIGPGISTLALIESGLERIVTLEHDDEWYAVAVEKFKDYPQVTVGRYVDDPVATGDIVGVFDVAFVDSPKGFHRPIPGIRGVRKVHPGQEDCSRLNTCLLALKHAPVVYLHDATRPLERGTLGRLNAMGHTIEHLPGAMARITRHGENANGASA